MSHDPVIIALDVASAGEARALVAKLGETATFYKVGMELYAAAGMEFVRELTGAGKRVFLDLKFYDIGETVKRAVMQVAQTGVTFLTVHASGGVMRAAVEGRGASGLKLLAVTVLTSVDQKDLEEDGCRNIAIEELVRLRVHNAVSTGVDGIVCSPLEVRSARVLAGPDRVLVVPGVRSAGRAAGDQKRVATPAEAMRAGADYLVIGRQVTRASDPHGEVERVREELSAAAGAAGAASSPSAKALKYDSPLG